MINWHLSTCRRPHIKFLDIGVPSCLSCGEVGTIDEASFASAARKPPETPQQADFELRWPASLPFIEDVPNNNGSTEQEKLTGPVRNSPGGAFVAGETPAATGFSKNTTAPAKTSLYEPLYARKIRILRLLPGTYHDPIRCKLRTMDLQLRPEYEALSYTWADSKGDASLSQPIYVGDRHDILIITVNCVNALRRLRLPNWTRDVWVDTICIDQDNIKERSHQVGIMRHIYTNAERVLIYLGEDEEDSNRATSIPWQYDKQGNTLDLSADLRKQPYFTRIWVIQEVASARSAWILLGSRGARWADFLKPPDMDDANLRPRCIRNYNLLKSRHPWLQLVAQPRRRDLNELWGLLSATAQCEASDPRDKVFALLGLFTGSNDAGLIPDYSLSLSQILCGLAAFSLRQFPDLWPQIFAVVKPNSLYGMPTWTFDSFKVPDEWLDFMNSKSTACVTYEGSVLYSPYDANVRFAKGGALVLKGVPLLSLDDCILTMPAAEGPPGIIKGIQYQPFGERGAGIEHSIWARKGDKLYAVAGMSRELLILRPLQGTNKQSFVGICDNIHTDLSVTLLNLLDRKNALLFSTWNEILGHRSHDWFIPQAWNEVRNVCHLIREHGQLQPADTWIKRSGYGRHCSSSRPWRRRQDAENAEDMYPSTMGCESPLLRLRRALEKERQGRHRPCEVSINPYPEHGYTARITLHASWQQNVPQVNFADFLLPICWHFRKDVHLSDTEPLPVNKGSEFMSHCHPGYLNSLFMDKFWRILGLMLRSKISYHASGYESATNILHRLISQRLSPKSRDFDALVCCYKEGVGSEQTKNVYPLRRRFEDVALLRWIRNSMELTPNTFWEPDGHYVHYGVKTWAEDFCYVWKALFWEPGLVSHRQPSQEVFEGNPEEEGVITENFGEALDNGLWVLERGFEAWAWFKLRELVCETEQHLLPLERMFLRHRSSPTCANRTEEMKWEDVYIV